MYEKRKHIDLAEKNSSNRYETDIPQCTVSKLRKCTLSHDFFAKIPLNQRI